MANFLPRDAYEWYDTLRATIASELSGTPLDGLTIDRSTDIGAEVWAMAVALAQGDVQRAIIFWSALPQHAQRFGLLAWADELGLGYTANTSTAALRELVTLALRTNVGTRAWYQSILPMTYPADITDVIVEIGRRGPGSIELLCYRNGDLISDAMVATAQALMDGETARLTTDRVYVGTAEQVLSV